MSAQEAALSRISDTRTTKTALLGNPHTTSAQEAALPRISGHQDDKNCFCSEIHIPRAHKRLLFPASPDTRTTKTASARKLQEAPFPHLGRQKPGNPHTTSAQEAALSRISGHQDDKNCFCSETHTPRAHKRLLLLSRISGHQDDKNCFCSETHTPRAHKRLLFPASPDTRTTKTASARKPKYHERTRGCSFPHLRTPGRQKLLPETKTASARKPTHHERTRGCSFPHLRTPGRQKLLLLGNPHTTSAQEAALSRISGHQDDKNCFCSETHIPRVHKRLPFPASPDTRTTKTASARKPTYHERTRGCPFPHLRTPGRQKLLLLGNPHTTSAQEAALSRISRHQDDKNCFCSETPYHEAQEAALSRISGHQDDKNCFCSETQIPRAHKRLPFPASPDTRTTKTASARKPKYHERTRGCPFPHLRTPGRQKLLLLGNPHTTSAQEAALSRISGHQDDKNCFCSETQIPRAHKRLLFPTSSETHTPGLHPEACSF